MQGWDLLDDAELRRVWDRFYDDFAFRPSVYPKDFPGIREPHPSITWALRRPWDGDGEVDLHTVFLAAFRACTPPDGFLYALDWQHPCYRFQPHDFRPQVSFQEDEYGRPVLSNGDYWPVPVLPNGDYYIFLVHDFTWGVFGHPWEWTMCVFGETLLTAITQHLPQMFATIVRQA